MQAIIYRIEKIVKSIYNADKKYKMIMVVLLAICLAFTIYLFPEEYMVTEIKKQTDISTDLFNLALVLFSIPLTIAFWLMIQEQSLNAKSLMTPSFNIILSFIVQSIIWMTLYIILISLLAIPGILFIIYTYYWFTILIIHTPSKNKIRESFKQGIKLVSNNFMFVAILTFCYLIIANTSEHMLENSGYILNAYQLIYLIISSLVNVASYKILVENQAKTSLKA